MSTLTNALPAITENECIRCYLERANEKSSCDGTLRAVDHYRGELAPKEIGLTQAIKSFGIFCDCEYRMNTSKLKNDAQHNPDGSLICHGAQDGSLSVCSNWVDHV
ncbi:DUF2695 domain-containing protein [Glutamicibacter ardleyensis]|uniref:DUF2695 domain-containing protein n=1 Tax=Glutamicibacter ardleyensis TaxID=225894 RepID=UPI003FD00F41